jgi:hypothetical protein
MCPISARPRLLHDPVGGVDVGHIDQVVDLLGLFGFLAIVSQPAVGRSKAER